MPFVLDKTGTLAANKINSEIVNLTGRIINTAIIPKESLFYSKGLVVRTGPGNTGTLLVEGVHYNLILPCTTLAAYWGRITYGGLHLLTKQYTELYLTYQTVGGVYSRGATPLNVLLNKPADFLNKTWESVLTVPVPAKADLTLHRDTGDMATLMTTVDNVIARVNQLGRI